MLAWWGGCDSSALDPGLPADRRDRLAGELEPGDAALAVEVDGRGDEEDGREHDDDDDGGGTLLRVVLSGITHARGLAKADVV